MTNALNLTEDFAADNITILEAERKCLGSGGEDGVGRGKFMNLSEAEIFLSSLRWQYAVFL